VRVLAHWPIQELDLASGGRDLLQQQHLMHVVAGEPVGGGDQDTIQFAQRHPIPQPLQARSLQTGAAVAVIAEDVLGRHGPTLLAGMRLQAFQLLGQAVGLRLALGGHPRIDPDPHGSPPVREARGRPGLQRPRVGSTP
jgi:hypothetical protein